MLTGMIPSKFPPNSLQSGGKVSVDVYILLHLITSFDEINNLLSCGRTCNLFIIRPA